MRGISKVAAYAATQYWPTQPVPCFGYSRSLMLIFDILDQSFYYAHKQRDVLVGDKTRSYAFYSPVHEGYICAPAIHQHWHTTNLEWIEQLRSAPGFGGDVIGGVDDHGIIKNKIKNAIQVLMDIRFILSNLFWVNLNLNKTVKRWYSKGTWMGVMLVLILLRNFRARPLLTKGINRISCPCLNKYCQRAF